MSDYIYDREALLTHAKDQAAKLVKMNTLIVDLKRRMGLEIDPDGHFETWRLQGGIEGLGTHEGYTTLTNDELIERHKAAQAIIAEIRRKREQAGGYLALVK